MMELQRGGAGGFDVVRGLDHRRKGGRGLVVLEQFRKRLAVGRREPLNDPERTKHAVELEVEVLRELVGTSGHRLAELRTIGLARLADPLVLKDAKGDHEHHQRDGCEQAGEHTMVAHWKRV